MNLIPLDVVPSDVPHRFHREGFAANLNLVAFHRFLDGSTDVANPNINSGILTIISDTRCRIAPEVGWLYLDTSVCSVLHCSEKIVMCWIE